jgi:hypothetical protein
MQYKKYIMPLKMLTALCTFHSILSQGENYTAKHTAIYRLTPKCNLVILKYNLVTYIFTSYVEVFIIILKVI